MKHLSKICILSSLIAVNAYAGGGVYLGVDYLKSSFVDIPGSETKEEKPGYAVQLGYNFNSDSPLQHGVELEYFNAGRLEYTTMASSAANGSLEMTGYGLNYKPKFYIERFYLSAQVGYTHRDASGTATYSVNGQTVHENFDADIDKSGLTFGGELGFDVTNYLSVKGGYRILEKDTSAVYAGLGIRF